MDESGAPQDVVVLPPLLVDPVFSGMVEDAMSGPALPGEDVPGRRLGSDPHDFAGLYLRHRGSFALHARRFLRDNRDVEEVVQEAFLRLFLALPELETELQALAYCRRTISNLCIDRYRADQRRPRLVDLDSVLADQLVDEDPDIDPVVQAEDAALVRLALSLLSPAHREALVKREIEEKSLPAIAVELDIPEESVKHLLFRARRSLRRLLAGTGLDPGVDPELASTLQLLARRAASGGGKVAGAVVLLMLALGSGPNLHAIPLVGTDLPDLPSLLELAHPAPPTAAQPPAGPLSTTPAQLPGARPGVGTVVLPASPGLLATTAAPAQSPGVAAPPLPSDAAAPAITAAPISSGDPAGLPAASPAGSLEASAFPSEAPSADPSPSDSAQPSDPPSSATPQPAPSPASIVASPTPGP